MEGTAVDIVVFAPLAPILGVLLFWFIKMLFIESQKYFLEKIRPKHDAFCKFTNFLGVLFQTICHALGYTITKSGISDFYISVNYGKVDTKKEKKGVFEWIANAFLFVGPFFIPAVMLLVCLVFLLEEGFSTTTPSHLFDYRYTFGGQLAAFGSSLYSFSANFFNFLINIDLFHPGHLGFFILLTLLGLGIRPSYIGEKKVNKVDLFYDLRNIWDLITHKPLYVILLFVFSYLFFYISFYLDQAYYVVLFSVFAWLSIISIAAIFVSHLIIILIFFTDRIEGRKKIIPYLTIPLSYILARVAFVYIKTDLDLSVSFLTMVLSTAFIIYLILKPKGDKFKTKRMIKWFKGKKTEEKQDE